VKEDRVLETRRTPEGHTRRRRRRELADGAYVTYTTVELPEDLYLKLARREDPVAASKQYATLAQRQEAYAQLRALFDGGVSCFKASLIVTSVSYATCRRVYRKWKAGVPIGAWDLRTSQAKRHPKKNLG
jgi:hypothetical protein